MLHILSVLHSYVHLSKLIKPYTYDLCYKKNTPKTKQNNKNPCNCFEHKDAVYSQTG